MLINVVDAREFIEGTISVPETPGIYAWFRRLSVDDISSDSFTKSISTVVASEEWPTRVEGKGTAGPYSVHFSVQPRARQLSKSNAEIAESISNDPKYRSKMSKLVLTASVLQPPLYVGETQSLSSRINQHLSGGSQFTKSMGSDFDRFELVFSYLEIETLPSNSRSLLEAIVGTVALPRYAQRVG